MAEEFEVQKPGGHGQTARWVKVQTTDGAISGWCEETDLPGGVAGLTTDDLVNFLTENHLQDYISRLKALGVETVCKQFCHLTPLTQLLLNPYGGGRFLISPNLKGGICKRWPCLNLSLVSWSLRCCERCVFVPVGVLNNIDVPLFLARTFRLRISKGNSTRSCRACDAFSHSACGCIKVQRTGPNCWQG
eukprot:SAG31_NODE_19183_length_610_cov_0.700587_1_plen_189_part_10